MSHLEKHHPQYVDFLLWHKKRCGELYSGRGNSYAHAYVELTSKAKDWVTKSIRG